jgi:hypothetical protein
LLLWFRPNHVGGWLSKGVTRVICDGFSIFFWSVSWMGEVPLRVYFSRLFPVLGQQGSLVRIMGNWAEDELE